MRPLPLVLALTLCCGCSQQGRLLGAPAPDLENANGIDVAFNHRTNGRYRSPLTKQWRNGDDLEQLLIGAIDAAEQSVQIAVQELTLPRVAFALIQAQKRGLRVQIVLENTYNTAWSEQQVSHLPKHQRDRWNRLNRLADANGDGITTPDEAHQGDAVALLKEARIPLLDDTEDGSRGSGLMHHKFVILDQAIVITGSANFTSSGLHGDADATKTRGNVNHLLRLNSAELANIFGVEFEQLWGDGPGGAEDSRFGRGKQSSGVQRTRVGNSEVAVLFTPHSKHDPNNGLNWISTLLSSAKQHVDMALFVFSAQQLADVLQVRAEAGVKIRLLADRGFASRSYSEILDLLGVALPDRNCKLEQDNQPFEIPLRGVGTPHLARGDKLHHKFAVIDNKTVITGSFNWSPSAAHTNDETLLVIHSPQLAKHFTREMDRLWDTAELGITPHIQRKLDRQRIRCGDGVERD